ncbi:MAG: UvrD-helicase domain-containing protein [Endomicrobiales bacterium]
MNAEERRPSLYPEVRVVEASAGSGKTYALARRYVQLLINPQLAQDDIPLRAILAITFTNKATLEMKERILEFLKKIALNAFSSRAEEEDLLSSLGVPREAARQKAFFVMDRIIRNYHFFQVQTIDSFINAIVSGCSFTLGLSSRFTIEKGYDDYLSYSLDALVDRAGKDPLVRGLFKDFLTQYLHVENRLGWLPRRNILSLAEELFTTRNTFGGEFRKLSPSTADDLFAMKDAILREAKELRARLPEGTHKTFAKNLASFAARESFSVEDLSKFFSYEAFPANKGAAVPEEVERLWRSLCGRIQALCRHEAYSFYNCYIDIFAMVYRNFRELSRREDVLFLPELNRQANELFARNAVAVPEIYYRLATRFRHFLIDEFQDTSDLQWKNLLPMVEEILSSGGSLFYVGDKKQAIYRFRGGDATLFDRIPAYFANFKPRLEVLSTNYRSHREIVEFNNALFSEENLRRFIGELQEDGGEEKLSPEDVDGILRVFADSRQNCVPGHDRGLVKILPLEAVTVEERNGAMKGTVQQLVRGLRQRFSCRDIAFLTRDNDDIELLTGWLLEEKIPVESDKTLNVRENVLVKELMSFLMFLNSPIDDLSFASFVLGEVFLQATSSDPDGIRSTLFAARPSGARESSGYLYRAFRERYPGIWDGYVEEFFVSVGFVPVYELLASILQKFRVMERFPEHYAFVMRLLELVKAREEESSGIASFIDYFKKADDNELFVAVTDADAVRLLTIHKAKGLEFPVVILPFLEMKVNGPSGRNGAGMYDVRSDGSAISLVRLNRKHAVFSDELKKLYLERYRRSFIDELNAIYVALTRAKCELYAYVPRKASSGANPVRLLIPGKVERGEEAAYPVSLPRKKSTLLDIPVSPRQDWIGLLKDEFAGITAPVDRDKTLWGEFIHYALSRVDAGPCPGPDHLSRALEKAQQAFPSFGKLAEAGKALERLLASAAGKKFFFVEDGTVYREKEVVDRAGITRRIDRLVVRPDRVEVIDYKSSRDDNGAYQKQVKEYMSIVGELYPGRSVTGYLLYIDSLEVEGVS